MVREVLVVGGGPDVGGWFSRGEGGEAVDSGGKVAVLALLVLEEAAIPAAAALRRSSTLQALRAPARAGADGAVKYSDLLPPGSEA